MCVCVLCVQEAVRSDSLDQSGSADDLAEPHLTVPTISSTPPRQRSSSVHTLKYTHPQRVISCRSHSRSHSETTGQERVPEQPICGSQPETDVEKRPVSPQSLSSLKVPSGESTLSAPLCSSRAASSGPGSDPGPQLDPADEEVSRINSSVHANSHTQRPPSPSHKSRHLSPSPVEHRSRLSQSVSPVSGRNRKQRMSPPPGEEPVITATQLMDSSVELRRRTLSFDATTLSPNQTEGSSVDNWTDSVRRDWLFSEGEGPDVLLKHTRGAANQNGGGYLYFLFGVQPLTSSCPTTRFSQGVWTELCQTVCMSVYVFKDPLCSLHRRCTQEDVSFSSIIVFSFSWDIVVTPLLYLLKL